MRVLDIVSTVLLIIGALNWGLVGFFGFNLVSALFGEMTMMSRVIYSLVGIAALYDIGCFTLGFKETQHRWCDMMAAVKH